MQFLMGLDDVFSSDRRSILVIDPLPDVKYAFATLSRDESHRNSNVYNSSSKASSSAFIAKSNNDWSANKNGQNKRFNRGPNPNLVCKHCNMIGHTIDRCFELVGYPPRFKKNPKLNNSKASVNSKTNSNATHTLTNDEYKRLMNLLSSSSSGIPCDIKGNVTGIPVVSGHVFCFASCRFFNFNPDIFIDSTYIGWIIDSVASQHMTYTAMFFVKCC